MIYDIVMIMILIMIIVISIYIYIYPALRRTHSQVHPSNPKFQKPYLIHESNLGYPSVIKHGTGKSHMFIGYFDRKTHEKKPWVFEWEDHQNPMVIIDLLYMEIQIY